MLIVEQGRVVEVCAEPGEFTYDTSSEPSIFAETWERAFVIRSMMEILQTKNYLTKRREVSIWDFLIKSIVMCVEKRLVSLETES